MVQAYNGSDRLAIWDYDVVTHAFGELLAGHHSEDIVSLHFATADASELRDVVTDGLKRHTDWFDTHYAHIQASLDASPPEAHGYAVFQPQFRGSTGFGKHFEEAG